MAFTQLTTVLIVVGLVLGNTYLAVNTLHLKPPGELSLTQIRFKDPITRERKLNEILQSGLFGTSTPGILVAKKQVSRLLPEERGFRLHGVGFHKEKSQSYAHISYQMGEEFSYKIGDILPEKIVVVDIHRNAVVLRVEEVEYLLKTESK